MGRGRSAPGMSNIGGTMMLRCSMRMRPSTSRSISSASTNSSASWIIRRSNQTRVTGGGKSETTSAAEPVDDLLDAPLPGHRRLRLLDAADGLLAHRVVQRVEAGPRAVDGEQRG